MGPETLLPADCDQARAGPHGVSAGATEPRAAHAVEPKYALVVLGGDPVALAAVREAIGSRVRVALVLPEASASTAPNVAASQFGQLLLSLGAKLGERPGDAPPESTRLHIYRAAARFLDRRSLEVGGRRLHFRRAIIATGVQPAPLEIPGRSARASSAESRDTRVQPSPLEIPGAVAAGALGVAQLGRLAGPPGRMAVIGSGPDACFWAQTFGRLGSRVHLVAATAALLPGEEPEAAALLAARLQAEGVCVHLQSAPLNIERTGNLRAVVIQTTTGREKLLVDEVLICTPPVPRLEGLGLEAAGVAFDERGILVDERMCTSCRGIFAAGRVCWGPCGTLGQGQESGRRAARNALGWFARRLDQLGLSYWVPTDPEVVRLGLSRAQAAARAVRVQTLRAEIPASASASVPLPSPLGLVQSPAGGQDLQPGQPSEGLVIFHVDVRSRRVVGATAVGQGAGELLSAVRAALGRRQRLDGLRQLCAAPGSRLETLVRLAEKWRPAQRRSRLLRLRTYLRFVARRLIGVR